MALGVGLGSCQDRLPKIEARLAENINIYPDYENVTVPANIAPLNFSILNDSVPDETVKGYAMFKNDAGDSIIVKSKKGFISIPINKWKSLLANSVGKPIDVTIYKENDNKWYGYQSFKINIAADAMDSWVAYRLIEPGYEGWNEMGFYQRNIETFDQEAIYENYHTHNNCVNCHSFCNRDPNKMMFHMRAEHAGTFIIDGDKIDILNTKTKKFPSLVYPSWHPSGDFIAFSSNKTYQNFPSQQRVECYDTESDIVVYDIKTHSLLSSELFYTDSVFETFPSFSADGKTLYYCSARYVQVPDSVRKVRYNLCSVEFNPETKTFGSKVDTLIYGERDNVSVSYPRISPDGKYMVCTLTAFGTFPIWHKEADLYIVDLKTKQGRYMTEANSDDVESYHSWSSNSKWMVFGSRRMNGLYTRPFVCYIDSTGKDYKSFVLPQKERGFYQKSIKSYNIPEFIVDKVPDKAYKIRDRAEKPERTKVNLKMQN